MIDRSSGLALVAVLLIGCRPDKPACETDQLEALAERLNDADPRAQPDIVLTGLSSSCKFSSAFSGYLESLEPLQSRKRPLSQIDLAARRAAMDRACPSAPGILAKISYLGSDQRMPTLYDSCDLDRYGVLDRQQFLRGRHGPAPWALHQLMLDSGANEAVARVITRALFVAERRSNRPFDVERLPRADAPLHELPDAIDVTLTTDELRIIDTPVASLRDGELDSAVMKGSLIVPLSDALSDELSRFHETADRPGHGHTPRLNVGADERTRVSIVGRIFVTAARRGIDELALVVESGVYEYGALPILPATSNDNTSMVWVEIDDSGALAIVQPERETLGHDLAALSARVATLCADGPSNRPAVIQPSPNVAVGRFVEVAIVLRGLNCSDKDSRSCCFPRLILDTPPS